MDRAGATCGETSRGPELGVRREDTARPGLVFAGTVVVVAGAGALVALVLWLRAARENRHEIAHELASVETLRPWVDPSYAICHARTGCTSVPPADHWYSTLEDPVVLRGVRTERLVEELVIEATTGRILARFGETAGVHGYGAPPVRMGSAVVEALGVPLATIRVFDASTAEIRASWRVPVRYTPHIEAFEDHVWIDGGGDRLYDLSLPDLELRPLIPPDATDACATGRLVFALRAGAIEIADERGSGWARVATPGEGAIGTCRSDRGIAIVTWRGSRSGATEAPMEPTWVEITDPSAANDVPGVYVFDASTRTALGAIALPWAVGLMMDTCHPIDPERLCFRGVGAVGTRGTAHLHVEADGRGFVLDDVVVYSEPTVRRVD